MGDKISPGANACFNDTNLAVAFNVTDKVDFAARLDEQLQQIETVNVTEKFQLVLEPLSNINSMLGTLSDTALSALNQATNINSDFCPFQTHTQRQHRNGYSHRHMQTHNQLRDRMNLLQEERGNKTQLRTTG